MHRSPCFGFSQEFAEYRAYAEGDDPRFVDWNVYARTDRTYIKRYIGETNTRLMIALDTSASMGFGSGKITKLKYAQVPRGDARVPRGAPARCGRPDRLRRQDPRAPAGVDAQRAVRPACCTRSIAPQPGTGTDMRIPFERFREVEHGRGLVAVISDFYCDPEALLKSVQPLAYQGQDVILFQLLDPQELKPVLKESALLEDMESGQSMEVSPIYMSQLYRERIGAHVDALHKSALRAGADHRLVEHHRAARRGAS